MIDFKNLNTKSRISVGQQVNEQAIALFGKLSNDRFGATAIPDEARKIVASMPTLSIATSLIIGGIFGWLTSKR